MQHPGRFPTRVFSDFEPQFLKSPVQRNLFLRVLVPWNQVRLASPNFSRSDLAAEYYDRLLFKGATFGDLSARPGAPFLVINASDETLGERFEFTLLGWFSCLQPTCRPRSGEESKRTRVVSTDLETLWLFMPGNRC